ncbi:MAG TPA: chromate resistance protein, partial [Methylomirabilota bacterium]|nr:chromate resistance protein [Methylomirabilota bacterium]
MSWAPGWMELVISLPTESATERMRVWRALKATGAAVLRDGVYVLPERPDLEEVLTRLAGE